MIGNGPNYLNQYHNPNLAGVGDTVGMYQAQAGLGRPSTAEEIAEKQRYEAEAKKFQRSETLVDVARQLEYMRRQLIQIDVHAEAKSIDQVIGNLMMRWHEERNG